MKINEVCQKHIKKCSPRKPTCGTTNCARIHLSGEEYIKAMERHKLKKANAPMELAFRPKGPNDN